MNTAVPPWYPACQLPFIRERDSGVLVHGKGSMSLEHLNHIPEVWKLGLCCCDNPNTGAVLTELESSTQALEFRSCAVWATVLLVRSLHSSSRTAEAPLRSSVCREFKSVSSRGNWSQLITVWYGKADMLVRQISEWPIQFCVIFRSGSAARISSQGLVAANGSPPSTSAWTFILNFEIYTPLGGRVVWHLLSIHLFPILYKEESFRIYYRMGGQKPE